MDRISSGILIYGAGGHGKVVADIIERQATHVVAGFLDDNPVLWGTELLGYKVLGGFRALANEGLADYPVIIAVGDNQGRIRMAARLESIGRSFASAIHPSAQIARDTRIGPGAMVMANVAINTGTRIGAHVIVNTSAAIDHDCLIHNFVHVSPGAVLAGNVVVGEGAHIGMGCSILPNIRIGAHSVVGAGAVVTRDIDSGVTAVGVPARTVRIE